MTLKTVKLYSTHQQFVEHSKGIRAWYFLRHKNGDLAMEGTYDFIKEYIDEKLSQGIRIVIQLEK
tara:strand:- start:1891 stop:2085 length:195 start_codon:yes stop_codon:yes gene_type:complete